MTNLEPLGNRVIVKRDDPDAMKGKIIIPPDSRLKPIKATVIAVGPGKRMGDGTVYPVPLSPGDKVLINRAGGIEVEFEGEALLIMGENEILARVGQ